MNGVAWNMCPWIGGASNKRFIPYMQRLSFLSLSLIMIHGFCQFILRYEIALCITVIHDKCSSNRTGQGGECYYTNPYFVHYENTPIQIYRKFHPQKLKIFKKNKQKNSDIFHISAQNIDCGYSLETPRQGGSNECTQSMFCAERRKILYTPVNPSFTV